MYLVEDVYIDYFNMMCCIKKEPWLIQKSKYISSVSYLHYLLTVYTAAIFMFLVFVLHVTPVKRLFM